MAIVIVDDGEISYSNPIGQERTEQIEELLRNSKCFVPSFAGADPYLVETYVRQYALHQTETQFLLDRNIYSDVLDLAKGKTATFASRTSAAIMAFAACGSIMVEPVLAMHEGASSGARGGWKRDLALFSKVDNIHPLNWAMLAGGDFERFTRKIVRDKDYKPTNPFNPRLKLRTFGFNYPALLKLAILVRRGGDRNARMEEFIEWMYWEWQFSAPTTLLAIAIFSKNPPSRAFKGHSSANRYRALRGVWNAAWDMVYVQEWFIKVKTQDENGSLYVLCTRDALMIRVGELLRKSMFEGVSDEDLFQEAYLDRSVLNLYRQRTSQTNDLKRGLKMFPDGADFIKYRRGLLKRLRKEFQ